MNIEHIAIWSRDIEKLRHFYETYFAASSGPRYTNKINFFSSCFLSFNSGAQLELMQMLSLSELNRSPIKSFGDDVLPSVNL